MNNFIHAKSGLQVIKKKKKGKKNRRGRGKKGNGNANQEQGVNENGNSLYENFPQKKSQNNFFQRGKQQQHARQGVSLKSLKKIVKGFEKFCELWPKSRARTLNH